MKVILIDDEKAMHLILKRMLGKFADIEIVGSFLETATAYSYLMNHEVDLILVDISMPRENGLEFAERLRENGKETRIVFITSHKEYALYAFDVFAFDYIVKPVVQDRLYKTIQRAMMENRSKQARQEHGELTLNEMSFSCLGGIDIHSTLGMRAKWKSSKSKELFGYLLMHKERLISRSRLIEDMFGDMPQKNAEMYLNTTVYKLRKVLEAFGLKDNLRSDSNHYALSLHHIKVDFLSFQDGCRQMSVIDESNIEQALELEQLYVGDLFGDNVFTWALNEVERLALLYTSFTQRLCAALLKRGDVSTAIRLLSKLMANNELDEKSFLLLMRALALQENKEALTRQYSHYAETLQREIGIMPSREAADLYKRLLAEW